MYCQSCGTPVPEDSDYCHQCGVQVAPPVSGAQPVKKSSAPRAVIRPASTMIVLAVVAVVAVAALALLSALGGGGPGSDENQIRSLLHQGTVLVNRGAFVEYYDLFSPESQANCPLERFLSSAEDLRSYLGSDTFEARDIQVDVRGDMGYASYDVFRNGEFISPRDGDRFVKINGRWYDDDETGDEIC